MTEHHVIIDGLNVHHDAETHELVLHMHHAPEGHLGGWTTECKQKAGNIFVTTRMSLITGADEPPTYVDVESIEIDLFQVMDDIVNVPYLDIT